MKEGLLVIDGKNYISSARAAQLVGYTKDYVGQLARAGKIDSKLIGRSWYVAEDSITKHKLEVHYTLTKPKKTRTNKNESETPISKITNNNIDKSSIPSQKFTPPSYAEIDLREDDNLFEKDTRDLFPVPSKKPGGRDTALLHSDIYYEKIDNKPEAIPYSAETAHVEAGDANVDQGSDIHVPVSIRTEHQYRHVQEMGGWQKTRMSGGVIRTDRESPEKATYNQRPTIDGIVVQQQVTNDVLRNSEDEYVSEDPYLEEDFIPDTYTRRRHGGRTRSRAIPVFGALIIFCVLALLYIIF